MASAVARASGPATLLVVSGGRDALPVIAAARGMGLRVLVSDGAPDAPGFRLADAGLHAGVCDVHATVAAVRSYVTLNRIDGVIGVGAASGRTVDAVTAALGLATSGLGGDQHATNARLRAAGVPVPWYALVPDAAALADLEPGACVIRPADAGDARVVVRLSREVDPSWAFGMVAAASANGRVVAERAADVPRVHALALVDGGAIGAVFLADRWADSSPPFIVPRRLDFPSRHAGPACDALLARAVSVLGVTRGLVEADIAVGADGPVLAGLSGALANVHFAASLLPLATGVPVVEETLRLALGRSSRAGEPRPRRARAAALRHLYAPTGTVMRITGVERAAAGEGIALCELHVVPGDYVAAIPPAPVGLVLATGDTLDQAIRRADLCAGAVRVLVVPRRLAAVPSATLH
jgi:L-amino acid ligase C-terminal domain 2